jgi:hypothetical protein
VPVLFAWQQRLTGPHAAVQGAFDAKTDTNLACCMSQALKNESGTVITSSGAIATTSG